MKNTYNKIKPHLTLINFFSLLSFILTIVAIGYLLFGQVGTGLLLMFASMLAQVSNIDLRLARLEKETREHKNLINKFFIRLFNIDKE